MSFGEVIINDIGGGGASNAGNFALTSNKTSQAEGGIARRIFLIIGTFVGFVDDD